MPTPACVSEFPHWQCGRAMCPASDHVHRGFSHKPSSRTWLVLSHPTISRGKCATTILILVMSVWLWLLRNLGYEVPRTNTCLIYRRQFRSTLDCLMVCQTSCTFVSMQTTLSSLDIRCMPVAPVAYQVIIESGIGQFRESEPRRVHTRINYWDFFLCTS